MIERYARLAGGEIVEVNWLGGRLPDRRGDRRDHDADVANRGGLAEQPDRPDCAGRRTCIG